MKVDNKVGNSNLQNVESTKTGKLSSKLGLNKTGAAGSSTGPSGSVGSSKVDLSDRAQMMAKAKEIASAETIDEAKVARLQKLIDEGKYQTDAGAIADRLVDEHMQFPD
jgi:negative regulator of flagellin synthesis FlgM